MAPSSSVSNASRRRRSRRRHRMSARRWLPAGPPAPPSGEVGGGRRRPRPGGLATGRSFHSGRPPPPPPGPDAPAGVGSARPSGAARTPGPQGLSTRSQGRPWTGPGPNAALAGKGAGTVPRDPPAVRARTSAAQPRPGRQRRLRGGTRGEGGCRRWLSPQICLAAAWPGMSPSLRRGSGSGARSWASIHPPIILPCRSVRLSSAALVPPGWARQRPLGPRAASLVLALPSRTP